MGFVLVCFPVSKGLTSMGGDLIQLITFQGFSIGLVTWSLLALERTTGNYRQSDQIITYGGPQVHISYEASH